jgi:hypothetical protein
MSQITRTGPPTPRGVKGQVAEEMRRARMREAAGKFKHV